MWELDSKESWAPKNWCFWPVVLEKTLESPLDSKEIKPVNPKGYQCWIFIGKINAEAEAPILWPFDVKSHFARKDPDAGKGWEQEGKGWQRRRWLDGITDSWWHESEQTQGDSEGQRSLVCCGPRDHRELDTTSRLYNNSNTLPNFPSGSPFFLQFYKMSYIFQVLDVASVCDICL